MARTLAELALAGAPLDARLRLARDLARAVAALHRRGAVHGALSPSSVRVAGDGDAVVLAPPTPAAPLELAGFAAPEVIRGGRPSRAADVFAAAALAQLVLSGRGPFEEGGADPLERARRTLFDAPRPLRLDAPAVPAAVEDAIARALERAPRRRSRVDALAVALEDAAAAIGTPVATVTPTPIPAAFPSAVPTATLAPSPVATAIATPIPTATAIPAATAIPTRSPWKLGPAASALLRRIPPSPLHRAALAAVPLLAATLLLLPRSDEALARAVAGDLARGDLAAARATLDAAPRGADRALVEKLRGDLACARRAPAECLRRYRTAIAARPALRADATLRRNVRALVSRDESCATQRSAALLAGELRDPGALPALEAARRSAGLLAFLCTGDALDRAIAATRAPAR